MSVMSNQLQSPDMRVFDAAVKGDHALFDTCLTSCFPNNSNWTKVELEGQIPITIAHFHTHARRELSRILKTDPRLGSQDWSERRLLLHHLAMKVTQASGLGIHLWHDSLPEVSNGLRGHFRLAERRKQIPLTEEDHPLRGHFKASKHAMFGEHEITTAKAIERRMNDPTMQLTDSTSVQIPVLDVSAQDAAVLQEFMQAGRIERLMQDALPFMVDIDETSISYPLIDFRMKMLEILEPMQFLHPETKAKLMDMVLEYWEETMASGQASEKLDGIEEEIRQETGIRDILSGQGNSLSKIIDLCIAPILEKEAAKSRKEKLTARGPLFEYVFCMAMKERDAEAQRKIAALWPKYIACMGKDFRSMGLIAIIANIVGEDASLQKLQSALM